MFEDILKTLVTAMLPILEIRGAIPVGVAAGMDPWTAFAIGFVGNMLPVPFPFSVGINSYVPSVTET